MAVPPELERAALEAVRSATISTNVNSDGIGYNPVSDFGIQVIPMPQLEDANDWYMFATDFPLRPFIFQNRRGVDTVLDDTEVARNRKLHYSAEMRGNAGYGFYQMAIKVTNS
jgi:phage major head subunit gpT-like protein